MEVKMSHKIWLNKRTWQGFALALLLYAALPDMAAAQAINGKSSLGGAAINLTNEVGPVAPLISALFWLGGAVLMGAGALKIKEHAENPTQTPMRQGIARMAVGAVLLTLPFFSQFAANTLSAGNAPINYQPYIQP
jgi:hypothetical protein